jgi:uncharacterized protein (UPF0332 family)
MLNQNRVDLGIAERVMLSEMGYNTVMTGKTHRSIQAPFNREAQLGNTDKEFVSLLNRLASLRPSARYNDGASNVSEEEAREMLSKAEDMLHAVHARAPQRKLSQNDLGPGR